MAWAIPILCYHRVGGPDGMSESLFAAHLASIERLGMKTIPLARLVDAVSGLAPWPGRAVVLTFDDGLVDSYSRIAPMLQARSMVGTFFAVTDFIDDAPARPTDSLPERTMRRSFIQAWTDQDFTGFMNSGEIRHLVHDLGMEVLPHSSSHEPIFKGLKANGSCMPDCHQGAHALYRPWRDPASLPQSPLADPLLPCFPVGSAYAQEGFVPGPAPGRFRRRLRAERAALCLEDFARSRARLGEITGKPCDILCWPWGEYDRTCLTAARTAGFRAAVSLERGAALPGADPMRLGRIGVANRRSPAWLTMKLALHSLPPAARLLVKPWRKKPQPGRVLLVTNSAKDSGGSRQLAVNASGLAQAGIEVTVLCPPGSKFVEPIQAENLPEGQLVIVTDDTLGAIPGLARAILRLVRERRVDTVHAFHGKAAKGAALARLLGLLRPGGAGFSLFVNRGVVFKPGGSLSLMAPLITGVVCNSEACRQTLARCLVPQGRVSVVHNGLEHSTPLPAPAVHHNPGLNPGPAPSPDTQPRVLYIGTSQPYKGLDVFLKAADLLLARHDHLQLVVAGTELRQAYYAHAPARTLERIEFLGHVPHARILEELARSLVYVCSSRQESMPNTILEAFACGLPVVATTVGGIPELIRDGVNGRLAPSDDPQALARAIDSLVTDTPLARRMGRINQALARDFLTTERKAQTLLRVYSGERAADRIPWETLSQDQGSTTNPARSIVA